MSNNILRLKRAGGSSNELARAHCADKRADRLEDVGRVDAVQPQKAVRRGRAGDLHGWAGDRRTSIQGGTVPLERAVVLAQPRRRRWRRGLAWHAEGAALVELGSLGKKAAGQAGYFNMFTTRTNRSLASSQLVQCVQCVQSNITSFTSIRFSLPSFARCSLPGFPAGTIARARCRGAASSKSCL